LKTGCDGSSTISFPMAAGDSDTIDPSAMVAVAMKGYTTRRPLQPAWR